MAGGCLEIPRPKARIQAMHVVSQQACREQRHIPEPLAGSVPFLALKGHRHMHKLCVELKHYNQRCRRADRGAICRAANGLILLGLC